LDEALSSIEKALNIKAPSDWNRVTMSHLEALGMAALFSSRKANLLTALTKRYPNEPWQKDNFARSTKSS